MKRISIKKLEQIKNPNLIDIRNIEEYDQFHLPGAIHIDEHELLASPNLFLIVHQNYYLLCERGITSVEVTKKLRQKGYRVYAVKKGYQSFLHR